MHSTVIITFVSCLPYLEPGIHQPHHSVPVAVYQALISYRPHDDPKHFARRDILLLLNCRPHTFHISATLKSKRGLQSLLKLCYFDCSAILKGPATCLPPTPHSTIKLCCVFSNESTASQSVLQRGTEGFGNAVCPEAVRGDRSQNIDSSRWGKGQWPVGCGQYMFVMKRRWK